MASSTKLWESRQILKAAGQMTLTWGLQRCVCALYATPACQRQSANALIKSAESVWEVLKGKPMALTSLGLHLLPLSALIITESMKHHLGSKFKKIRHLFTTMTRPGKFRMNGLMSQVGIQQILSRCKLATQCLLTPIHLIPLKKSSGG